MDIPDEDSEGGKV